MRLTRRYLLGLCGLGFLFVLLIGTLLTIQPRHSPLLQAKLEQVLSEALAPYHAKADYVRFGMQWTPWPHLTLHAQDVVIRTDAKPVARFPRVDLNASLLPLLQGKLTLQHVALSQAALTLKVSPEGKYSLGFSGHNQNESAHSESPPTPIDWTRLALQSARLEQVRLIVLHPSGIDTLVLPRVTFEHEDGKTALVLEEGSDASPARLKLEVTQGERGYAVHADLLRFKAGPILHLLPEVGALKGLSLAVNGIADANITPEGELSKLDIKLEGINGSYENATLFPHPLSIQSFKGGIYYADDTYMLENWHLISDGTDIKLRGTLQAQTDGIAGDLVAEAGPLPLNDLENFWPLSLAPETRRWVTTRIRDGEALGVAKLRFSPNDLKAPTLPDHCVDAMVHVTRATLRYLDHLPAANALDATIKITGETLHADITHAELLDGTRLHKGTVKISNFNDFTTPVDASLEIATIAPDVAELLSPARLNLAQSLALDPATLQGSATGTVTLEMIIYPEEAGPVEDTSSIVNYVIDATLDGVGQKQVMKRWDIEQLSGTFHADNAALSLEAKTRLQQVPVSLRVEQSHTSPFTRYHVKGDVPSSRFAALGLRVPRGITGSMKLDAQIEELPGKETTKANFDLTQTDLLLTEWGYRKAIGAPATLRLQHERNLDALSKMQFHYSAGNEQVEGYAQLSTTEEILNANLPVARINGHDLAVTYQRDAKSSLRQLTLRGAMLNLAPWMQQESPPQDDDDWMEDLMLDLDLGRVSLGDGRTLQSVKGSMHCAGDYCQNAAINARTLDNKTLSYTIHQGLEGRTLSMHSDDAGELLRVLEIAQHVRQGALVVEGRFDDSTPGRPLNASVVMKEFSLENAPALTRLLTLLSLTGLADTVSGNGIRFTKLSGEVRYMDDDLIIKKAKAYGPALGVTLEGEIANDGTLLALTGTLVPSYTANSLLGNLPLIGNVLVGNEGEGVFAARFSIKGPVDDPSVSVNPLSLLAPGFLRNLFEVTENKEANRVPADQKKPHRRMRQPVDATESIE